MPIVINEFEVTEARPETPDGDVQARPVANGELIEADDLAQRLAQLEERQLRLEAH